MPTTKTESKSTVLKRVTAKKAADLRPVPLTMRVLASIEVNGAGRGPSNFYRTVNLAACPRAGEYIDFTVDGDAEDECEVIVVTHVADADERGEPSVKVLLQHARFSAGEAEDRQQFEDHLLATGWHR